MKSLALLFALALPLLAQQWSFENSARADWSSARNATVTPSQDGLVIELTDNYFNLAAYDLNFSPKDCNYLLIRYSAEGRATSGGGYVFFGTAEDSSLDENKKFYSPAMIWDGREHEMVVDLRGNARGNAYEIWSKASAITKIRLDLVPEFPGKILVKEIRLIDLDRQEFLEHKFEAQAAAGIPLTIPVDMPNTKPATSSAATRKFYTSPMVGVTQNFATQGLCHLRKSFYLDQSVKQALWQGVCDDNVIALWINGREIENTWRANWRDPAILDIPANLFRAGENVMAITYNNGSSLGGVMADLQLLFDDNSFEVVTFEGGQANAGELQDGWQQPGTTCDWPTASTRPGPPAAPWTNFFPEYRIISPDAAGYTATLLRKNNLDITVRLRRDKAFDGTEIFTAKLLSDQGTTLRILTGTAEELQAQKSSDTELVLSLSGMDDGTKFYGAKAHFQWSLGILGKNLAGDKTIDLQLPARAVPGKRTVARVEQTPRGPITTLDGKPCFLNILTVHSYSSNELPRTGMEGHNSPFNLIAPRLGGMDTQWWVGPDTYDFSEVDRKFSILLDRYPDCKLAPYIWCQPSPWWYRSHYPERFSIQEDGSFYGYYVAAVTFANPEYIRDAQRALTALTKHLEKYFGSRVALYNLMGGISCEWQGWACQNEHFADYSDFGTKDFIDYAAKQALEVTAIPTPAERMAASADGVFRDPKSSAAAILYDQYYSRTIANCIAQIAAAIKRTCRGDKLVGAYYGYHQEYGNMNRATKKGGHNATQLLLDCPDIDFLLSPQSYGIRQLGAPNADMKPYGALRASGKFSILEDDTRTHLTQKDANTQMVNLPMTLSVLKRNIGMALSRGEPLNHLPLIDGNDLDDPAIRELFVKAYAAGQYLAESGEDPTPEIAAVIDEDDLAYLCDNRNSSAVPDNDRFLYTYDGDLATMERYIQPVIGDLLYYQRIPLAQSGAPADVVLLQDVIRNPAKYKVVIFLNSFHNRPELDDAIRALRENGTIVVFLYGTGFLNEDGVSVKALSKTVGMKMANAGEGMLSMRFDGEKPFSAGQPYPVKTRFKVVDRAATPLARYTDTGDIAVAEKDGCYFYGAPYLAPEFLRMIARKAGVHIYSESNDNLYASPNIVSIHANHAGHKVIELPQAAKVTDIYTGEVLGDEATKIEFDMKAFESRTFLITK